MYTSSPLGVIQIDADAKGLTALTILPKVILQNRIMKDTANHPGLGADAIHQLIRELDAYFSGHRQAFSVEIDWDNFSGFQKDVLAQAAKISYGEVRTYGDIAQALGKPRAARADGTAFGSNPLLILIPCHRVIGADGRLHGYAGGLDAKALLLRLEGWQIEGDRIMKLAR
jgi:methylated-DNA-[protein]-cysteine S-methyltransferase